MRLSFLMVRLENFVTLDGQGPAPKIVLPHHPRLESQNGRLLLGAGEEFIAFHQFACEPMERPHAEV